MSVARLVAGRTRLTVGNEAPTLTQTNTQDTEKYSKDTMDTGGNGKHLSRNQHSIHRQTLQGLRTQKRKAQKGLITNKHLINKTSIN